MKPLMLSENRILLAKLELAAKALKISGAGQRL